MHIQLTQTCSRPALTFVRSHHSTRRLSCQLNRGLWNSLASSHRSLNRNNWKIDKAQQRLPHAPVAACGSMSAALPHAAQAPAADAAAPANFPAEVATSTPRSKQVCTPEAEATRHGSQGELLFDAQTLTRCWQAAGQCTLNSCRQRY
jgi:hypothetical protein